MIVELLPRDRRRGRVISPSVTLPEGQSVLVVRWWPDRAELDGRGAHGLSLALWQQDDGAAPFSIRAARSVFRVQHGDLWRLTTAGWIPHITKATAAPLAYFQVTFHEEIHREDRVPPAAALAHAYRFQGRGYKQYAHPRTLWLEVDAFRVDEAGTRIADAALTYRVEIETDQRPLPREHRPIGMEVQ